MSAAIILAAGRGTRLHDRNNTPKPLMPIDNEPLLQRNLRQLHEIGADPIIVVTGYKSDVVRSCALSALPTVKFVHNAQYSADRNILSAFLALQAVPEGEGAILLEGDVVLSDSAIMEMARNIDKGKSIWTTCGHFREGQTGGIIKPGPSGRIEKIKYAGWSPELSGWRKNLGLIYISPPHLPIFRNLLESYAARSLDIYFMTPWAENLDSLPAVMLDLGSGGASFNTAEEYARIDSFTSAPRAPQEIIYCDVSTLRHIEGFDPDRVNWLANKIESEGVWKTPLAISAADNLVMDGQHRLEAARLLGLKRVPCIIYDYESVPVHSLRLEESVSVDLIRKRAIEGNYYPYKTVKHVLPAAPVLNTSLDSLR